MLMPAILRKYLLRRLRNHSTSPKVDIPVSGGQFIRKGWWGRWNSDPFVRVNIMYKAHLMIDQTDLILDPIPYRALEF
jgi:hypothetical protein